jgi:adenine/guanine phosphoribosyltransferase-like PRPP-binding protein
MGSTSILVRLLEGLTSGSDVTVIERGSQRLLRISWLNILNNPLYFEALSKVIAAEMGSRGYRPDAVASIETSGAKYGVALSLITGLPYFSIHKTAKLIFTEPVTVEGFSATESREVSLYLDRSIASRFRSVVLVDDIKRSSKTINSAVRLLETCGVEVEACFTILDLAFAGTAKPPTIPEDRYHPLIVISSVDPDGKCKVSGGLILRYLGDHV